MTTHKNKSGLCCRAMMPSKGERGELAIGLSTRNAGQQRSPVTVHSKALDCYHSDPRF